MRPVLKSGLILTLLLGVAAPAAAQPGLLGATREARERNRAEQAQQPPAPTPPRPDPPPTPSRPPEPPRPSQPQRPPEPQRPPPVVVTPAYPSYSPGYNRPGYGPGYGGPGYGGPIYVQPYNDPFANRRDDRDWNRPRYDSYYYPREVWSRYRYDWRGPAYRDPPGFSFRLSFGDVLARSWYDQGRYMDDWWRYDLPDPPVGMEWIRLGRDAVLFDRWSGQVYQVVREVFR